MKVKQMILTVMVLVRVNQFIIKLTKLVIVKNSLLIEILIIWKLKILIILKVRCANKKIIKKITYFLILIYNIIKH